MKKDIKFDAHFREGLKWFQSGRFAESLEEFFNAAQIDPSSSDLHYYIGEALERHKQQLIDPVDADGDSNTIDIATDRATNQHQRVTSNHQRVGQDREMLKAPAGGTRTADRYQTRIPIIVVAYDINGKFFAELAMTRVTSVKGAAIELHRELTAGAQLMIFTIDSRNAVPALVKNVQFNQERTRFNVGLEFLKGPVNWLVPE